MPERFRDWADSGLPPDSPGTVLTVGTFDGVHRGHQSVLGGIAERAEASGLDSVLVTFDPHPLEIVRADRAPRLLTVGIEKAEIVAASGIGYMAVLPFTRSLQWYTAAQFVDEILIKRFHMRELVIGFDHHFGRDREGSAEILRALGASRGFRVDVVAPVRGGTAAPLSSSGIRRAIEQGDLGAAEAALGRAYSVSGAVRHGEQRGRLLGFPTINLTPPHPRKLLPPTGVYAVRVETPVGPFGGMMNLGPRPTFGDAEISLEVHLFDAAEDLYGTSVKVAFAARLRDTVRFATVEALVAQLNEDAAQARRALTHPGEASNLHVSPRNPIPLP
ncbi:MAG: bifunctional riboflavin kinase/FAD synthetase [Gemmatimonadaceae bacterium]